MTIGFPAGTFCVCWSGVWTVVPAGCVPFTAVAGGWAPGGGAGAFCAAAAPAHRADKAVPARNDSCTRRDTARRDSYAIAILPYLVGPREFVPRTGSQSAKW